MVAQRRNVGCAMRDELARLLAAAYLRHLATRARKSPELAHLGSSDSPESTGYSSSVERESSCQITATHCQERRST